MSRFTLPGTMAAVWLSSAPASLTAPTTAELDAGVDLIGTSQGEALAEMEGFQLQSSTIATPDYVSHEVGNVPGDSTYPDSRLAFYKDDTATTIYDTWVAGQTGYLALMRDGRGVGEECELWPATIQSRVRRPNRAEAHIYDVNLAVAVPYDGAEAA